MFKVVNYTAFMAAELQDEILYCARCGISFLWSQEEQKWAGEQPAPRYCGGCRRLLPENERERGMVKWYDPRKQYGFLVRSGQPDIYVHRSALQGSRSLHPGDLVEFAVEQTERGPAAVQVVVVQQAAQAGA
jgi:CspA family cold shock protein